MLQDKNVKKFTFALQLTISPLINEFKSIYRDNRNVVSFFFNKIIILR